MNCKPALHHKHSVIVNHYETELKSQQQHMAKLYIKD